MLTYVNLLYVGEKSTMKTKKKALIIGLSTFGGCFVSAVFAAAFICTTPDSKTEADYEAFEDIAFVNSEEHVNSYKTTFNDKEETSEYEIKYENTIKEAGEKLAYYQAQESYKDLTNVYTLRNQSDNLATIYVEDFMDKLGKEIDDFFKQIKHDREKVQSQYTINYRTLKKAYDKNVSRLQDEILDYERYMSELDRDAEDYQYRVESYQYQIEITRVEIANQQWKYESDVAILNENYENDLVALDAAEEQVIELKENYEAQVESSEEFVPAEYVDEVVEEDIDVTPIHNSPCIYRESNSVSLTSDDEKEEQEQANNNVMVETLREFNPDLFTFKCFDNCYLYIEPKDKESYWHF